MYGTLISSTTVTGSAVGNILFSSIPATYTDLVLVITTRTDATSVYDDIRIQFNGDNTTANYSFRSLLGSGSAASSTNATPGYTYVVAQSAASATANTFGNGIVYIPNYTSSNQKSFSVDSVSENNATAARQGLFAANWTGTAAIDSVNVRPGASASQLNIGTTVSLYGLLKGSGGATAA